MCRPFLASHAAQDAVACASCCTCTGWTARGGPGCDQGVADVELKPGRAPQAADNVAPVIRLKARNMAQALMDMGIEAGDTVEEAHSAHPGVFGPGHRHLTQGSSPPGQQ